MRNPQNTETVSTPSILWALVNTKTGKIRSFSPTREAARQKREDGLRVIRYVADFSARA